MQLISELLTLKESAMKRYLGCSNSGDGPDYKVFKTPQEAYDYVSDANEWAAIVEFDGELMSIELGSRGEVIVNDGGKTIFERQNDDTHTDELGLAK